MTGMYNVLEKLRSGESLTAKEKTIHEQGLVSVLKQLHDELDSAVMEAYGWPETLSDEEILERLVTLNHERAEEEKRGLIRWLRPEYQCPTGTGAVALAADEDADASEEAAPRKKPAGKAKKEKAPPKRAWPKALPAQAQAVRQALVELARPAHADEVAKCFKGARKDDVAELLETLVAFRQADALEDGRYVG